MHTLLFGLKLQINLIMKEDGIRILLVEDEFITLETLKTILAGMNYQIAGEVMDADNALGVLEKGETDLAILDINIKGNKDGIWLAEQIQKKYNIPFIFLTAFGDQATVKRAINTEPSGYIVKPFSKVDIFTAIEVALKNFARQNKTMPIDDSSIEIPGVVVNDSIFIRDDYMFIKIKIEDILFIKSDKNYLDICLAGKKHLVRGMLKDFIKILPASFLQVHRSYAVNVRAVESFGNNFLKVNNVEIPVGKTYKDELRSRFNIFLT